MAYNGNLSLVNSVWHTCACTGQPVSPVTTDPDSVEIVPHSRSIQTITSQLTKLSYTLYPNQININVHPKDAEVWVTAGTARYASQHDRQSMKGFLTRRSIG